MNCVSINPRRARAANAAYGAYGASRAAYTFIELLIALAIASAFLAGTYGAFNRILEAHSKAEARLNALRNGRAAITTISDEFKMTNRLGTSFLLLGVDDTLPYGDGRDTNGDGIPDEKPLDAQPSTTSTVATADLHAQLGSHKERPSYVGREDEGDGDIDTDVKFGHDSIILRIFPRVPTPDLTLKTVTYSVDSYDGLPNVLVKRTRIERDSGEPLDSIAPIAFDVLGFDLLYWNPNAPPDQQYWVTTWDSSRAIEFASPNLPLPATVFVRLTMNADMRPHSTIVPGSPVDTVLIESEINIEQTINDALFPRPIL